MIKIEDLEVGTKFTLPAMRKDFDKGYGIYGCDKFQITVMPNVDDCLCNMSPYFEVVRMDFDYIQVFLHGGRPYGTPGKIKFGDYQNFIHASVWNDVLAVAEPVEEFRVIDKRLLEFGRGGSVSIVDTSGCGVFGDGAAMCVAVETATHEEDGGQDGVNHPSHYAWLRKICGVEPLDVCRHLNFNVGNAVKYLLRKDKKDGDKTEMEKRVEDLRKAVSYIEDEIRRINEMDAAVETAAHEEGDGE